MTLIVLVIGKAQFRRAMLSCDSSCSISHSKVMNMEISVKDFSGTA